VDQKREKIRGCVCRLVCVCVCERQRERERQSLGVCYSEYVCVRECVDQRKGADTRLCVDLGVRREVWGGGWGRVPFSRI